jgi:hypothetical protein
MSASAESRKTRRMSGRSLGSPPPRNAWYADVANVSLSGSVTFAAKYGGGIASPETALS